MKEVASSVEETFTWSCFNLNTLLEHVNATLWDLQFNLRLYRLRKLLHSQWSNWPKLRSVRVSTVWLQLMQSFINFCLLHCLWIKFELYRVLKRVLPIFRSIKSDLRLRALFRYRSKLSRMRRFRTPVQSMLRLVWY